MRYKGSILFFWSKVELKSLSSTGLKCPQKYLSALFIIVIHTTNYIISYSCPVRRLKNSYTFIISVSNLPVLNSCITSTFFFFLVVVCFLLWLFSQILCCLINILYLCFFFRTSLNFKVASKLILQKFSFLGKFVKEF